MMLYLFNNDEQMIKAIPSTAIKSLYQTQVLTDENYINDRLDVELKALDESTLNELEYVAISNIEDEQKFHYYFVNAESTEDNLTTLTATQSGIEELRKTPVYDMRPNNNELRIILNQLLDGTNWSAGYVPPNLGTLSTNFYYTDVFSSLKKVCLAFGVEMQFFVEVTGNRIGARYIDFYKRTGKAMGKRVVYGHNALKIIKEVEKTNIVTALIGRGKGVQVSESEEGHAGYGRKITFEDVVWSTPEHPVNKPLGQRYVEIPELTAKYGIKNFNGTVRPKFGFIEFPDDEEPEAVLRKTYDALLEQSRPQTLMKTTSLYLPDTGIGDTVRVIRHDRELYYDTRVFEIVWDRLVNRAVDMRLGDRLSESNNRRLSNISNQIVSELEPTIVDLIDRLPSSDGKNTNWYTEFDPAQDPSTSGQVRVGDIWWQPDPESEGDTILNIWTGEMWKELVRTADTDRVARRIEEIEQEREDMQADIDQAQRTADDLFLEWENMKDGIEFEMPEMFIDILGDDGKYIYSDNELEVIGEDGSKVTSDEVVVTLEDGEKRLTSGKGHSIGNSYTLSYVNLRFEERPHSPITVNLNPKPINNVTVSAISQHEPYPNYSVTNNQQTNAFPKGYHDTYTVALESDWYEPQSEEVEVNQPTEVSFDVIYKTGRLTVNSNDAEILIDGESTQQAGSVTFNASYKDKPVVNRPKGSVEFILPGTEPSEPPEQTESNFTNARIVNLADYGGQGNGIFDNFNAFKQVIADSVNEPLVLEINAGQYYCKGGANQRLEPWPAKSKGLKLVGNGVAEILPENNRTNQMHEYYFMQMQMTPDSLGFEVAENIIINGIKNPQEELFYTQTEENPVSNIVMCKGFAINGAKDVYIHDMTFKNMYGGYAILAEEYDNVNIKNVTFDKVGGNDIQESFGMAIYLGGHEGDAVVNIDNVHAQGMVTDKELRLSWIGVVLENGTIQSDDPAVWRRDVNTTVNITNSSFIDYQSTFHVESMAGNVYWNVDNLETRASNYQIVAGVYGEYKETSNNIRMDMMPYGRLWGIVKGLYYSEAQESEDNWNGHNLMNMYNSVINLIKVAGFEDPVQAVAYGSNVTGRLHNSQINDLPHKLVSNGSALLYNSEVNLAQGSSETRQSLQNGNFSDASKQRVEFNNTNVNPYGSHKNVTFGPKPAFVKNEGFVPPVIDLPITAPI